MTLATVTATTGRKARPVEIEETQVRQVPLSDISIDTVYQRDLDARFVQKFVKEYDERRLDPVLLSHRGGRLWCVDGQHRVAAARELGFTTIPARVLEGLSQVEEADLFVKRQRGTHALNAWDLFKADLAAGHEDAIAIVRICNRLGYQISRVNGHGHIGAIGAVRRVFALGAEPLLTLTLNTIRTQWSDDAVALLGQSIEGLALFFHSFRGEAHYDETRAMAILSRRPAATFLREARAIAEKHAHTATSATNVAEAIRDRYNDRLKRAVQLGAVKRIKATYHRSV